MISFIKKYKYLFIILCIIAIAIIIYMIPRGDSKMEDKSKDNKNEGKTEDKVEKALSVTSPAFNNGDYIPVKYTGRGEDISIPLELNNISSSGKSIVIIMDDPDAPSALPFIHWVIWNIPAGTTTIPEDIPPTKEVTALGGAIQGKNDFGNIGYGGPNPPSGTHTYRINVYVLDCILNLVAGSPKNSIDAAMKGHILQSALLEGKFSRN